MAVDSTAIHGPARSLLSPLLAGQGLISETFDRRGAISLASIAIDGTAYFVAIDLQAGQMVTNVSVAVQVAGNTVTLSKVGLYSSAGTRLAISADQVASWQSTGLKTVALIAPYSVPSTGLYYAAVISKATITVPTFVAGGVAAFDAAAVGTGSLPYGTLAAQTDLPASAAIGTTAPISYWMGLS